MDGVTFSVVVATRNRPWDVECLLASLDETGAEDVVEVILADDASDPPVRTDLVSRYPVRVVRSDLPRGAAVMRNRAVAVATGSVVAFLDDDARVFPDWFTVARSGLASASAVTGRIIPLDDGVVSRARQWRYEERYRRLSAGDPVRFFAGGNSAVRRDAFLTSGGFPDLNSAADNALVEGLEAQGLQVAWTPALNILHRNSKGVRRAAEEAWRSGAGRRPIGPASALGEVRRAASVAPWRRDVASATLNLALQVLHSTSAALRQFPAARQRLEKKEQPT